MLCDTHHFSNILWGPAIAFDRWEQIIRTIPKFQRFLTCLKMQKYISEFLWSTCSQPSGGAPDCLSTMWGEVRAFKLVILVYIWIVRGDKDEIAHNYFHKIENNFTTKRKSVQTMRTYFFFRKNWFISMPSSSSYVVCIIRNRPLKFDQIWTHPRKTCEVHWRQKVRDRSPPWRSIFDPPRIVIKPVKWFVTPLGMSDPITH